MPKAARNEKPAVQHNYIITIYLYVNSLVTELLLLLLFFFVINFIIPDKQPNNNNNILLLAIFVSQKF